MNTCCQSSGVIQHTFLIGQGVNPGCKVRTCHSPFSTAIRIPRTLSAGRRVVNMMRRSCMLSTGISTQQSKLKFLRGKWTGVKHYLSLHWHCAAKLRSVTSTAHWLLLGAKRICCHMPQFAIFHKCSSTVRHKPSLSPRFGIHRKLWTSRGCSLQHFGSLLGNYD
jgi:hypothetical protein